MGGFTIDNIQIYCGDRVNIIENAKIGVSGEKLGEYDLILPVSFTQEQESGKGRQR